MKTSPDKFKEVFRQALLDLLWRQWTTLGVAGHAARESRVIDPDALLLGTCVFGRQEPRLFDEMLDWLGVNGWCINVQRVRSLMKRCAYGCERVVASVAALQARGAETAKWRRLSLCAEPLEAGTRLEPLFYLADGRPQPAFGRPEPHFERYGFHRGAVRLRGMSRTPNPDLPANLMFRLRALFGVNARADILAYLLTHDAAHPPETARQMGYFPKTIQMTLAEMACSGNLHPVKLGREKHYRLDLGEWGLLRAKDAVTASWPEWVGWPQFFATMAGIWNLLEDPRLARVSPALQAAEWQKEMHRLQPLATESKAGLDFENPRRLTGATYLESLQGALIRRLAALAKSG